MNGFGHFNRSLVKLMHTTWLNEYMNLSAAHLLRDLPPTSTEKKDLRIDYPGNYLRRIRWDLLQTTPPTSPTVNREGTGSSTPATS